MVILHRIKSGSGLTASTHNIIQQRLAQLSAHLVIAIIILVVIGGATRVMEAGLACPDWPLCYGSLLPREQMNIKVFLEWFHRLDAFVVGLILIVQLGAAIAWQRKLPHWFLWVAASLVLLVVMQGFLGALTVTYLLPGIIITAHLGLALTLLAIVSALTQCLQASSHVMTPLWWRLSSSACLLAVLGQCLLGARMATNWSVRRCLTSGGSCELLGLHRVVAIAVTVLLLLFVALALAAGGWFRQQWPLLALLTSLTIAQVALGMATLRLGLSQSILTIGHQLVGALLVALMASLAARRPTVSPGTPVIPAVADSNISLEPCHG